MDEQEQGGTEQEAGESTQADNAPTEGTPQGGSETKQDYQPGQGGIGGGGYSPGQSQMPGGITSRPDNPEG